MSMEADFITWLRSQSSLQALIGQRLYSDAEKQGVPYPFVSWRNIYGDRSISMDGPNNHKRTDIEILVHADKVIDALAVRNVLENLIHGLSGQIGTSTIQGAFVTDGQTTFNSVMKTNTVELQVEIHHN